ncbi:MAG: hypothetical protein IT196_28225, partial [Acidimicrobiales bacterium]|nr:hypothetical protein [Acidimicrobiales bacterium]
MRFHPFSRRCAAALSALALLLATLLMGEGVVAAQAITAPNVLAPLAQPAAFFPLTAQRVYEGDTGLDGGSPFFGPDALSVPLTAAVPSGATAVAVNVTAFSLLPINVTVCGTRTVSTPWHCNSLASSADSAYSPLQPEPGGVSLMATVALGPERTLTLGGLYAPGRVAVDLLGYYAPAGATPAAGRYRPGVPQRVLDTRDGLGMVEDRSITVSLGSSVPADTSAVMATITVVDAERDSYVTAYATGSPAPFASNLLVLTPTRTLSNQIVVPVSGNQFDL